MRFYLKPLQAANAADFYAVMQRANPEAQKCLCTASYVEHWKDPSLAQPCRSELFRLERFDGFLLYRENSPVGWCQVTLRDQLSILIRGRKLDPDPEMWAISCMVLAPEVKGQKLSHEFLTMVLDALKQRGVRRIQAFACRYRADEDTSQFVEFPESLCKKAGMTLEHDHEMRPIYGIAL